ncbi:MAG TPA: amidohydrolase family protein [Azospirillaceae bacterium]|nr:amidohydrolase family protein [Azospirillaceae bacterium]
MLRRLALLLPLLLAAPALAQDQPSPVQYDQKLIAITGVTLVDGTGAPARRDVTVVLRDGRIADVGPSASVKAPEGATIVEGKGRTLLPGLVLMHEHMFYPTGRANYTEMLYSFPRLYLAGGTTTLRTAGTMGPYADLNLRAEIEAGKVPGPDMDVTAPYLNGPGLPILKVNALGGVDDAQRMVEYWAAEGVTSYKAYMHIRRDELKRVIETAHAKGHKVTAHLCSVTHREAAEMGIDNLEHGFAVATDFVADKKPDVCPSPMAVQKSLAELDVDSPQVRDLIATLVARKVALTSTLTIFETFTPGRPKAPEEALSVLMPQLRAQYERRWEQISKQADSPWPALLSNAMKLERMFVEAGGTLLVGTDPTGYGGVVAGFASKRAIELLVEAGFGFERAVSFATLNGARFLGRDREIGTVEPGKRADLVLVEGDAVSDPTALRRMPLVFKNGIAYRTQVLIDGVKEQVGLN